MAVLEMCSSTEHHETTTTSSWTALPIEIRDTILGYVTSEKYTGWSTLAYVSRDWQAHIEKINFRSIRLRQQCLDCFARICSAPRIPRLIRHIHLIVELRRYSAEHAEWLDAVPTFAPSRIVDVSVKELLKILSSWEKSGDLTLELHAYSPSDEENWFRPLLLNSEPEDIEDSQGPVHCDNYDSDSDDEYAYEEEDAHEDDNHEEESNETRSERNPEASGSTDPSVQQYYWEVFSPIQPFAATPRDTINKIYRPIILENGEHQPIIRVSAVTRLVILRQLRRTLMPRSLKFLMESFGQNLEHIEYEPWASFESDAQRQARAEELASTLYHPCLDKLKSLTLFEEAQHLYKFRYGRNSTEYIDKDATALLTPYAVDYRTGLAASLARRSLALEHLSASFMVCAESFFAKCLPEWTWPKLRTLSLTAQLLGPLGEEAMRDHSDDDDEHRRMVLDWHLRRVAEVARRMPKLETLVLWTGGELHACAFVYQRCCAKERHARLTWRGTEWSELAGSVVRAWQKTAQVHAGDIVLGDIVVCHERVSAELVGSHADAIYHLALPCQVVNPVSLWQMQKEATPYYDVSGTWL
ncbi:uncharacterized protein B0I36DRAFT_362243 [Microdochium trichocladiopsis]|uniref:DUF6546 domain-containing protein n=1 Tax=Microdochium trichocladiopsis TaxID=1682393 RepID=A0A9P9BVR5_9PEZI|nr:uncharacterized protein B0I36DRAFT_362243 [Microdochium trichocladiopsis]KAH7033597.1 hypothetical protein B0I36DRAFT_362243 [Microdochium trichocladiopsis]